MNAMTNSRKWAIWMVILSVAFLICAATGYMGLVVLVVVAIARWLLMAGFVAVIVKAAHRK